MAPAEQRYHGSPAPRHCQRRRKVSGATGSFSHFRAPNVNEGARRYSVRAVTKRASIGSLGCPFGRKRCPGATFAAAA